MKISRSAAFALYVSAAASLSAGCSGTSQPSPLGPTFITNETRNVAGTLPMRGGFGAFDSVRPYGVPHPDRRKSWVSPDAKGDPRLLFASDSGLEDVNIYSLPSMKLKGQLTGFSVPQGMCADSAGNVYVADTNATQVVEYSHAGSLVARYADNYGFPIGCAVDPATGNLAVTDLVNDGSGPGEVQIFSSPSAQPRILVNPSVFYYYFAGYGPDGSLWVSGTDANGVYMLSRCGASSCSTISLSGGTLYFPGAVQWDKVQNTWVVFDQLCGNTPSACSYPVSPSGALGKATTYSNYKGGNDCDLIQGEIANNGHHDYVVGGDYEYCGAATSTFDRWTYAAGGTPTNRTLLPDVNSVPNGVAISIK